MTNESKFNLAREIRFYSLLALAAFLLIVGLYTDPPGHISRSVLIASGGLVTQENIDYATSKGWTLTT